MNKNSMRRVIAGVEFEAVRFHAPCPHWRVKVVATGYVFEAGVFRGMGSLDKLMQSVEDTARARDRHPPATFAHECLTAK